MTEVSETANIVVTEQGPEVTITCSGSLDFTNTSDFHNKLRYAAASAEKVVVDLRDAMFIDTAVLEYIARAGKAMLDRGKRLEVVCAENSHPERVLKISGFDQLMDIKAAPSPT